MATALIKPSFASGELAPSLWGRVDLAKFHSGASVMRNMFPNYRGGSSSRAGLGFVGQCLQAGTSLAPPRIIPFRFSVFQNYILEFGDQYMRVAANGAYVTEAAFAITGASQANPCVLSIPGHNFVAGNWIFLQAIGGMFELNTRTVLVASVAGNLVTISSTLGFPINSLPFPAYTSGGTAARIFTLTAPYAAADLRYLKFTQSADVMTLCCVNQESGVEYPTYELTRHAANSWTLAQPTFTSSIVRPPTCAATGTAWSTGPGPAAYGYVVTAIDAATGEESVASPIGVASGVVDIAGQFGSNTVSWTAVTGAAGYNVYRAFPDYTNTGNFTGQLFGFVGSTTGATSWQDSNIIPDFTTTPPLHENPFAGAGNAPMVPAYFQQRRFYGGSLNNPDGYNFSQPGAFLNFDSADPPIDSDAIAGNPWAQQVNGIQWAVPMPGGLLVGTGLDAWQVSGTGGAGSPITPSQQSAQPQESYGFAPTLSPIRIGTHILYVQTVGTIVQDLEFNFWNNMYAGTDISILSSHLFTNYQLLEWASARQPYKIVWAVRNDGKLLSLAYMKEQEVAGWSRHDTNGLFQSCAVATEPPVDAPYFIVKRYIPGVRQWAYYLERMDDRQWTNDPESCFCVDAGVALAQPQPNAILTASAATATLGALAGNVILGGSNYSLAVTGQVIDRAGKGAGAIVSSVTVVAGAITAYTISPSGAGYVSPQIVFSDPSGTGAAVEVFVDESVTFSASAPVFAAGNVGSVIRMGGGKAVITTLVGPQQVIASFITPITATVPDDPNHLPIPAAVGEWSMTAPVTTLSGLDYLEGMAITGVADGAVIAPTVVNGGQITLSSAASSVVVGLPFTVQLQSMHTDLGQSGETVQGKAIKVQGVTVRIEGSRDFTLGQDRPIASAQPNQAEYPWTDLARVQSRNPPAPSQAASPLFTGDRYIPIRGDWSNYNVTPNDSVPMPGEAPRAPGMVACQQDNPLPLNILALVPQLLIGDSNDPADLR